ncbi:MAG: hypothetical protein DCE90_03950 [Pseudanabaena sp.]|nr:MAG: hypothetical protein DCE90_03950 [Pseudanabaena sp.]
MNVNNSRNYVAFIGFLKALKSDFRYAFDSVLRVLLHKDSKTLSHYSLKALQISQNHLRLSFYMTHISNKNINLDLPKLTITAQSTIAMAAQSTVRLTS